MKLSEEQLQLIEAYASKCLSPEEVALIVGLDYEDFETDIKLQQEAGLAYMRGYLKTKSELHEGVKKLAKAGSGPAQNLLKEITDKIQLHLPKP